MVNPAELRAIADERERLGCAALDAGDVERGTELILQAFAYRAAADELERKGLPVVPHGGTVVSKHMTTEAAEAIHDRNIAISQARNKRDKLARAVRERMDMSLNAYSRFIGISPAALYKYRHGQSPAPAAVRARILADTGYALPIPPPKK